jgi:hypothetical protein
MLLSFSNVLACSSGLSSYHDACGLKSKLSATDGAPIADLSEYRSLAGALQDLALTRPDLAYAV